MGALTLFKLLFIYPHLQRMTLEDHVIRAIIREMVKHLLKELPAQAGYYKNGAGERLSITNESSNNT